MHTAFIGACSSPSILFASIWRGAQFRAGDGEGSRVLVHIGGGVPMCRVKMPIATWLTDSARAGESRDPQVAWGSKPELPRPSREQSNGRQRKKNGGKTFRLRVTGVDRGGLAQAGRPGRVVPIGTRTLRS
jgi:hypothetical protein